MAIEVGRSKHAAHALASGAARRISEAATKWLESLTPEQRSKANLPFEGDERYEWHYTPVHRNGLALMEMTGPQIDLALAMMDTALSNRGAVQARDIMRHEYTLGEWEKISRFVNQWNRDVERYYFTVHGDPRGKAPWGVRVGGHHIGIHYTIAGGQLVSAMPHFYGANPHEVRHGPDRGKRILSAEEDLARALLASLDGDRKKQAITSPEAPRDILTRNDRAVKEDLAPRGVLFSQLADAQRSRLVALVQNYTGRISEDLSMSYWRRIESAGLDSITFAWQGPEEKGKGHYYAVQGPTFLIEYDNTQNGANHVHAVLRDFTHDWGEDMLKAHYQGAHSS